MTSVAPSRFVAPSAVSSSASGRCLRQSFAPSSAVRCVEWRDVVSWDMACFVFSMPVSPLLGLGAIHLFVPYTCGGKKIKIKS